ncbi:shikimate dehydrogenase family protein [Sphingobium boeckii]|uniref:Shikimate dehydrogenase (NADP(+)) n=1 Tax=Sphingobium boeckii TaxID=1082345 RepID=A0A7W9AEJ9_9SPHN|nr:shikimate dehydrogenase [Sphingobium boeckii]MBB5684087.1 shikimate dehydrogenase [Sphingobium boeckii]
MNDTPYAEVIGDPIAHSKSPLIHGFWLKKLGIDAAFRTAHVKNEELAAYFESRKADPLWRGCNVTVPHKLAVMDFAEDRGGVRASIGAMNTILRTPEGALIGTNTDAAGFYAPLAEIDLAGKPVTVIGAGGGARAVLFALARCGVGPVTILNRNVLKGASLLAAFGLKGKALPLDAMLPPSALIVNASALGMKAMPPFVPDLSAQPEDCIVYDIVYAPLQTGLLAAAEARDLATIDGLEMLVGQAAVAFELFFGAAPPREHDEALRALLIA